MVSFITVNTAGAFAAQRPSLRDRVSGRVEQRNANRRSDVRSQVNRSQRSQRSLRSDRPSINRSTPLSRRPTFNRPNRPINRDVFRRDRTIARPYGSFFNRSRVYHRQPSLYRGRPYYGGYHRSSSLSPLEFFGIGAAIIAIAAAASHAHCDY